MITTVNNAGCLSTEEYQAFGRFLRSACGIDLGENKQYLVATRIRRVMVQHQIASFAELIFRINGDGDRQLRQNVIDAMTTNETLWFRDGYPFDFLANHYLPDYVQRQVVPRLRIWSAACSSGQEPYSLSIVMEEFTRRTGQPLDAEILATDLSVSVLEAAQAGFYDRMSVTRGLSEKRLQQFFVPAANDLWALSEQIRKRVRFRSLNLQESYLTLGRFQIIFCRNVLIYFSAPLKMEILRKLHDQLEPGGLLFLGASESIAGAADLFEMIHINPGVIYRAR